MSLAWAFGGLLLCSAVYEPLRSALYSLGDEVGGVGGVGGLTNLWNPGRCDSVAGRAGAYCFHEGVLLGLTPFAWIFLLCWVAPFALLALRQHKGQGREELAESDGPAPRSAAIFVWAGLTALWFAVPAAAYTTSPFYQKDMYHVILALALAAAFPLSWHLSLVAVPAAPFLTQLLGRSRKEILGYHKMVATSTWVWAAAHAGGELVWLLSQGSLASSLDVVAQGENMLFVFGVLTAAVLAVHVGLSQVRRKVRNFKQLHGLLAAGLLLVAAAHWWPFTFLLIPAVGVHATSAALRSSAEQGTEAPPQEAAPHLGRALSCATFAATGGMIVVWRLRQSYMMSEGAGLRTPFLFPPAAILAGFASASLAAGAVIRLSRGRQPGFDYMQG